MFVCKGNNGTIMRKQPSLEPLASVPDNFQSQGVLGGGGVGRCLSPNVLNSSLPFIAPGQEGGFLLFFT